MTFPCSNCNHYVFRIKSLLQQFEIQHVSSFVPPYFLTIYLSVVIIWHFFWLSYEIRKCSQCLTLFSIFFICSSIVSSHSFPICFHMFPTFLRFPHTVHIFCFFLSNFPDTFIEFDGTVYRKPQSICWYKNMVSG